MKYQLDRSPGSLDELWLRTISDIKSAYGRLVYLARLRNPDTGRYEHYGPAGVALPGTTSQVLRRIHESFFRSWIGLSLEQKKADIDLYISEIDVTDKAELIDAWLRLTPYKNLVPFAIQGPERQRHMSDFEAILGLLKNVYGVVAPDRDA